MLLMVQINSRRTSKRFINVNTYSSYVFIRRYICRTGRNITQYTGNTVTSNAYKFRLSNMNFATTSIWGWTSLTAGRLEITRGWSFETPVSGFARFPCRIYGFKVCQPSEHLPFAFSKSNTCWIKSRVYSNNSRQIYILLKRKVCNQLM